MVWIKFHDKLCKGAKRGLSRATRFVFLELCLESRPGRGVLDLPVGMSDLDGLHDVLGGSRKELADALKALVVVPKATPEDPEPRAMIELTGEEGARRLTIPSWDAWNSGQETPGASTERSRRHRQRSTRNDENSDATADAGEGNSDATVVASVANGDATVEQRSGNGAATPYRGEERREEEIRSPLPPTGGRPANVLVLEPTPSKRQRHVRGEVLMPASWSPTTEHANLAAKEGVDMQREAQRFRFWAEGKKAASWNGRFAQWLMKAGEDRRSRGEPPHARPAPDRPRAVVEPRRPPPRMSDEERQQRLLAAVGGSASHGPTEEIECPPQ